MNVRGYERLGRAEGLEALFVESAVADAAAASGLDKRKVLDLLLALVDRPNRRKGEPRSADQLVATAGIAPDRAPMIATALKVLEARELVRTTSTGWQLDHDYLARGILRAEANAERWRTRLAQLARQHEAASGIWGWWRTLLTPWEQVSFLAAWLRGRRPYGAHASFARTSVVRLLPPAGAALAGMLVIYVVDDYLTSSTPLNVLSYNQSLSDDEASAFVAIAQDGPVARSFFAWRSFNDPNDARKAAGKAPAVARAITRLDARAAGDFRDWLVVPAVLSPEPTIRNYALKTLGSVDATPGVLDVLRAALLAAKGDPSATSDLAQAYAAAAQKLPANAKREAASTLLAASGWCLTETVDCFAAVTASVQSLDADRPLPIRTAKVVEFLKFPQSAVADESPLTRLAASPQATAEGMPTELWAFLAWVAKKYPDIDLTSGPSVERLAAVGGS